MDYDKDAFLEYADEIAPRLTEIRRDLHRHPELGFEEFRTTARIKEELAKLPGVEVKPIAMKTGVMAELKGSRPGAGTIALRCDIDALPICEEKPADHAYKSEVPGKMHACGHDGHVATNLGAAMMLAKFRPEKNVRFLFQPAEETTPDGAPEFLACGVLDGVDEAWGFHLNATSDFGNVGWYDGTVMAGGTRFEIFVKGKSVHGSYPEEAVNPAVILSRVAVQIDGLKSMVRATRPYSLTLLKLQAGDQTVATPHEGLLAGRIGFHEKAVDALLRGKIKAMAESTAEIFGGKAEVKFTDLLPLTYNDPRLGDRARASGRKFGFPLEQIFPSMGSDDFGYYGREIPTYYLTFGIRKGADFPIAHTPAFDFDEAILPRAAAVFASLALD
ncbi:MAG: M20 family metallopeptidase [Kiritimatiellae bacterium]|nr:M20 family metallopeptidase [Kiritimatiellia bacterium]